MAIDRHSSFSPSSDSPRPEARHLFDDYDSLNDDSALENQKSSAPAKPTPLPKAQLATLCVVRLVDPIVFTQIFPYVNEMMDHLHLTDDPSKIGFYSGLVVSPHLHCHCLRFPTGKALKNDAKFSALISRRAALLSLRSFPYISGQGYLVCLPTLRGFRKSLYSN